MKWIDEENLRLLTEIHNIVVLNVAPTSDLLVAAQRVVRAWKTPSGENFGVTIKSVDAAISNLENKIIETTHPRPQS